MSTGNSLAHVDNEGVRQALTSMAACLKAGGYLYLDTRNWDKIIGEKERFFLYNQDLSFEEIEVFNFGPDNCDFQDMNWYAIITKKK